MIRDININTANKSLLCATAVDYLNIMSAAGFINVIQGATRVTNTLALQIDHCFIRSNNINQFSAKIL